MALPASGAISFNNVNVELGLSGTATISLNDAAVRTLFGVASGAIAMSNGYGKANQFAFSITSNQTNYNLRSAAIAAGWNQSSAVVATINGGVYVYSTSTGTPALTVNGSWPGGVSLVNNGYILGQGGNGGPGGNANSNPRPGTAGSAGGLALSVSSPTSITNNGTIGGGGGGGGGGGTSYNECADGWAGGGGGGGQTGLNNSSGGSAGGGSFPQQSRGSAPGGAGTSGGAGGGGQGAAAPNAGAAFGGAGGSGGSWGTSGSSGGSGGGIYGGAGGGPGGSAGAATSGSASYITWVATGTRYGSIG